MPQRKFPGWCCQRCGAPIGYLGRALQALFGPMHKHASGCRYGHAG